MSADLRRATRLARRASQVHKAGDPGEAVRLYAQSFEIASQCRAGLPSAEELFALHNAAQAAKQLSQFARNRGLAADFERARRLMFIAFDRAREVAIHIALSNPSAWEAFEGDVGQFRRLYASVIHNWGCFQREAGVIAGPDGAGCSSRSGEVRSRALRSVDQSRPLLRGAGQPDACRGSWFRALECPTPSLRRSSISRSSSCSTATTSMGGGITRSAGRRRSSGHRTGVPISRRRDGMDRRSTARSPPRRAGRGRHPHDGALHPGHRRRASGASSSRCTRISCGSSQPRSRVSRW
jgi:hypothetical protein